MTYRDNLKRGLDIGLALLALVLLAPVLVGIALVVHWKMGPPVLFSQTRPGRHGAPFRLYKFRTMTNDRDAAGELLPAEQRVTTFGQFLRRTSLDELPELINVLRGEMSLVGPRPLLTQYLPLYSAEQMRRHAVRPGITGWAQVNGRNVITWEKKFALDVWYVDHLSLWLDLRILALTVWKVFRRESINKAGYTSMEYFTGSTTQTG